MALYLLENSTTPMPEDKPTNLESEQSTQILQARVVTIWMSLIRLGFSLLYHQLAWSYDFVSWLVSLGSWRDWQRAALPFVRGPKVLEVAHGTGHMLAALNQEGYQVTGIDLSPQMNKIAQKQISAGDEPVGLVRGSAQELPFAAATFDSILATFPTEFLLDPRTLRSVNRLLKHDGVFVIVPGAQLTGNSQLEKFIEWLYAVTGQRDVGSQPIDQAVRNTRRVNLEQFFANYGFELDEKVLALPRSEVTVLSARKSELGLTPI
jgi:ubiquinone/menaquinone biosynthesis C-methylase UbiE